MFLLLSLPGGHMLTPEEAAPKGAAGGADPGAVELLMWGGVAPPNPGAAAGRCVMFQGPDKATAEAYADRLGPPSAGEAWEVYELVPNHAPEFVKAWFGGKFAKAHGE